MEQGVTIVFGIVAAYGALGLVAALALHVRGLASLDPATRGAGVLFRLLITPGLVALWPVMTLKALGVAGGRTAQGRPDGPVSPKRLRGIHGGAVTVLAIIIPMLVAVALSYRTPYLFVRENVSYQEPSGGIAETRFADAAFFSELPVGVSIVDDPDGKSFVIAVAHGPVPPGTTLYWCPNYMDPPALAVAVHLGIVRSSGQRAFALGGSVNLESGALLLYSMLEHRVIENRPIPAAAADPAQP